MINVELDIFSGRSNPIWQLTKDEEKEFMERIQDVPKLALPKDKVVPKLGYRGFVIRTKGTSMERLKHFDIPQTFRIGGLPGFSEITDASLSLLESSGKLRFSDDVRAVAEDEIFEFDQMEMPDTIDDMMIESPMEPNATRQKGAGQSCRNNYLTSSVDFSFWNDSRYINDNNCYNFASNYRNNTFARPGRTDRYTFRRLNCLDVEIGVILDGYSHGCLSEDNIKIVLVIWPGNDFHFYRLCYGYRYCHKPGRTQATNVDNSWSIIYDVEGCNRGPYSDVCGYYYAYRFKYVTR